MKKLFIIAISMAGLVACDSGGGSSTGPSTAPIIASLRISPDSVSVGYGGGAATIDLYIDYYDAEGDISSFTGYSVKVSPDGSSSTSGPTTTSFNGLLDGKTSGTAHWETPADTTVARTATIQIYFTDKAGNNSNVLTGTFTVQ